MYCNQCGFRNPDNVPNCYKCGANMGASEPPAPSTPPPGFTLPPQPPPGGPTPPTPPPFTPPSPPPFAPPPPPPPPPGYGAQPPGYGAPPPYRTGPAPYVGPPQGSVPNYLVWSILVTLCCCLPFGIAAIVFSAQVNGKLQAGDYAGAVESSEKAKKWCWWGFGVGLVVQSILIALQVFVGLMGRGN